MGTEDRHCTLVLHLHQEQQQQPQPHEVTGGTAVLQRALCLAALVLWSCREAQLMLLPSSQLAHRQESDVALNAFGTTALTCLLGSLLSMCAASSPRLLSGFVSSPWRARGAVRTCCGAVLFSGPWAALKASHAMDLTPWMGTSTGGQ